MRNWQTSRLGDVCTIKYGKDHKHLRSGKVPVYGSGGIMRYVDTALYTNKSVLIPRKGSLDNLYFVETPFWSVDTLFYTEIDETKMSPEFLYYQLKTFGLAGMNVGSAVPSLTTAVLNEVEVVAPPLQEQIEIANTLRALDTKIVNNTKINDNLTQMAQTIFKMWFVDFEFPNQEEKPYKTSGGKMVYNDEVETEIPEGWEVTALGKVAEFTRGFSYNGKEKNAVNGDLVFMTLNSIYEGGGFKREFCYLTSNRLKDRHLLREGDIIIANTEQTKRGTLLGFPALVEFPNEYSKKAGCFSHHITKVTPAYEELKYYIYCYLLYNQVDAVKYHTGSVIWSLDVTGFIKNEKIVLPAKSVVSQFYDIIDAIFQKKLLNNKQVTKLSALRDNLLPMLITGKIRLPH